MTDPLTGYTPLRTLKGSHMRAYRTKEMPLVDLAVKSISNRLRQSTLGFMEVVTTTICHILYSSITYRLECPRKYLL